ncbi:phosphatase PAP2 family protein [Blastopirellula sp. J2-11]|uniref:phosphatase PAP2 family protein n=1 Tax=Blastopirellula sp. J2-11 TaxID=2943192 RepID=UPI0021C6854E|nr:phosphatase PAP2 family protein [Blastopirellula sp. J2-11]UUO06202.1 phosphatase PAP2 family protein [Blastopirellula sp. J2-11]
MSTNKSNQHNIVLPIHSEKSASRVPQTLFEAVWRERWVILMPLAILLAFTIACFWLPIDMFCSHYFYLSKLDGWAGDYWFSEDLCYTVSPLPGVVLGIGAIIVLVIGRWSPELASRQPIARFLLCVVIAGPLILVNGVIKPAIGRPRPNQLAAFGGERPNNVRYVAPWQLSKTDGKSFPSGHASMGFLWMAPAFLYWRRKHWSVALWLTLGLLYGTAIGFFRVAVGAHFLSDIVWSCGIVYFSGLAMYLLLGGWRTGAFQTQQSNKVIEITAASEAAAQGLQPEAQAA